MRVQIHESKKKLGTHYKTMSREKVLKELSKAEMRNLQYMSKLFQQAQKTGGLVDSSLMKVSFCLYCNLEKCQSHHFELKVISLLHQEQVWMKISPDMHITIPLQSHNRNGVYWTVFIIPKQLSWPVSVIVKKRFGTWRGPFPLQLSKYFKHLFLNCPKSNPKVFSLFHSALSCLVRNKFCIPDLLFPGNITELNGLWQVLQNVREPTP